jgi:hypothetical protein
MKIRTLICTASIALVLTLGLETGRAQSLGLAPAQVVEKFTPGVPFQFELSTVNNGPTAVEMHVQITDFWFNEKNEKVFAAPGTSPHSAANWIQFVPEHFEVPPHGTQKMRAIVTPPSDARGGYYATLFVESKPQISFDQTSDGRSVFTNMRIGCLVMLSAQSAEQFQAELSNVNLAPPTASEGLRVSFDLLNGSNTHIFPLARLAVLDAHHKLVGKAESEIKRFLPGQKDSMEVHWTGSLPPGDFTAVLVIPYGEDKTETRQIPFTIAGP